MENKAALEFMMARVDEFPQWVVTIAFYKAVHIVEAMFAADPNAPLHDTASHEDRNRQLKTIGRYQHIWKHYRALWNDSLIARYLSEESFDSNKAPFQFSMYLPPKKVIEQHVNHNLHQILVSARKLLKDDAFLKDCTMVAASWKT